MKTVQDLLMILPNGNRKLTIDIDTGSTLPLNSIQERQINTRELQQSHVMALAESIAVLGLLEPLVVDQGGKILAGGHRLAAIRWLKDSNPTNYTKHFPDEQVPVRIMGFDAQLDTERALAIEIAENEQRRDYTPTEVRALAARLKAAGYVDRRGRPALGEKPLRPQLEVIVGKSIRQLYRYLNASNLENRTDDRLKESPDIKLYLKQAKSALERWSDLPESKKQTKAAQNLTKQLPQFLELLAAIMEESNESIMYKE